MENEYRHRFVWEDDLFIFLQVWFEMIVGCLRKELKSSEKLKVELETWK